MALFKYDQTSDKLVPITSEGSIGLPVGAVMAFAEGTSNENWLECNGSTFDETKYPALYTYLGNSNVLPEKYETSKDTRVFMTVNDPNSTLSGSGIQIENASHVTSIEVAGATRSNQHNLARLAVDLTTATSLLFGFGGSNYTITINGTYNSTNDTWDIISNTNVMRGLFFNYDELGATETRCPLYIKAT